MRDRVKHIHFVGIGGAGMCGIAGIIAKSPERKRILAMTAALKHRGPDECGIYIDDDAALGHASRLYLAGGGLLGMNGNYSAGVLEGIVHFMPQTAAWLDQQRADRAE